MRAYLHNRCWPYTIPPGNGIGAYAEWNARRQRIDGCHVECSIKNAQVTDARQIPSSFLDRRFLDVT